MPSVALEEDCGGARECAIGPNLRAVREYVIDEAWVLTSQIAEGCQNTRVSFIIGRVLGACLGLIGD